MNMAVSLLNISWEAVKVNSSLEGIQSIEFEKKNHLPKLNMEAEKWHPGIRKSLLETPFLDFM